MMKSGQIFRAGGRQMGNSANTIPQSVSGAGDEISRASSRQTGIMAAAGKAQPSFEQPSLPNSDSKVNLPVTINQCVRMAVAALFIWNVVLTYLVYANRKRPVFHLTDGTATLDDEYDMVIPGNVRVSGNVLVSAAGGAWGLGNIVIGEGHIFKDAKNSFLAGRNNLVNGEGSSVLSGQNNIVTADYAAVSGGETNIALGTMSAVSGGTGNKARGRLSVVAGGRVGTADGDAGFFAPEISGMRPAALEGSEFHVVPDPS